MAKLTDVTAKADCSVATVSRIVNNYGYISQRTRKKAHETMRELNYQPNSVTRSLQGKKTKLIGLIFPDVSNPLFGELVSKIEDQLFNHSYKTILCNAGNDTEKERIYLQMLTAGQVGGIIAGAHSLGIEEYQRTGLLIVPFDRKLSDNIPIVGADNFKGGSLATQEPCNHGVRHIYFVGNPTLDRHPTQRRLLGYKEAIKELQLTEHIHPVIFNETFASKEMAIKDLLKNHRVGRIVTFDDLTALLIMNISHDSGIKIPKDLKIIGFDGSKVVRDFEPRLSTIVQPTPSITQLLIKLLERRIGNPTEKLDNYIYYLPVELLKRESSGN